MQRIHLKFDERKKRFGSKEHFWHLMLGYLLPSVNFYFKHYSKRNSEASKEVMLVYDDCGPLMNPVIEDLNKTLKIPFEIDNSESGEKSQSIDKFVYMPRWDIDLERSSLFRSNGHLIESEFRIPKNSYLKQLVKDLIRRRLRRPNSLIKKDILFVRNLILNHLGDRTFVKTEYMILDRSNSLSFYNDDGKAESKGYGRSRRALMDIKEVCIDLRKQNLDIDIYEPGSHSILHQIKAFNQSKGLVAIRGAELVNLLWMKKGRKAIVINPMKRASPHLYNLVSILGLKLIEREARSSYPNLREFNIQSLLEET